MPHAECEWRAYCRWGHSIFGVCLHERADSVKECPLLHPLDCGHPQACERRECQEGGEFGYPGVVTVKCVKCEEESNEAAAV